MFPTSMARGNVVASDLFGVEPATGKATLALHRGQQQAWDSQKRFVSVMAGTQSGKGLALDTPIPTPNGFVDMALLDIGDTVFGEDGKPCRISFVSNLSVRKCYRITFDDGVSLIADDEHQWLVQDYKQRKNQARKVSDEYLARKRIDAPHLHNYYSVKTTAEIAENVYRRMSIVRKRRAANYSVPIAKPVEYPEATLPVPPYTLGAWLGDGYSHAGNIVVSDEEIEQSIRDEGIRIEPVGYDTNTGAARTYRIDFEREEVVYGRGVKNLLRAALSNLELINNKHIPPIYLLASVEQRLQLLRGLMDTDGHCDKDGMCEFTNKRIDLAQGILELVRSLGIKARIAEGRAKLNGKDCGPKYRVTFATSIRVFNIKRKYERQRGEYRSDLSNRYIVDIQEIDTVPTRCIQVDNPSGLYLATRSYVTTHNTSFGPWWMMREIQRTSSPKGPNDYLAVTSTFPLLRLKMLPEFLRVFQTTLKMGRWWAADKIFELADPKTGKTADRSSEPMWGRVIFGSAKNADSLEAATAKAAWLDEAGQDQFGVDAWEAILRRLSLARGRALISTTLYNFGWLKQLIYDPWERGERDDVDIIQFESIMNPMFPPEEFERARRDLPIWKFNMQYRGIYSRPAGMIYDSFNEGLCALREPIDIPPAWPLYVGVDFGGVNMAAVFMAENPENGALYIFDEYLQGEKSIEQHAEAFKKVVGNRPIMWVGGAKPEDQWRWEFREHGVPLIPPPISEVEVGIARVYAYHKYNKIFVFPNCKRYLDEKGRYSRKLDELNQPTEEIENKNKFHMMDAERVLVSAIYQLRNRVGGEVMAQISQAHRSRWAVARGWSNAVAGMGGEGRAGRIQRGRKW